MSHAGGHPTASEPAGTGIRATGRPLVACALLALWPPIGAAQRPPTSDQVNEANTPLTPKITVNLQEYYLPAHYGLEDSDSNQFLQRGVLPHKLLGRGAKGEGEWTTARWTRAEQIRP